MAIALSNVLSGDQQTNVTTWGPAGTITPAAGELMLAWALTYSPGNVPTSLTGAGVTWVQVNTVLTSNIRCTLYRAMGAGSTGALTVTAPSQETIIGLWVDKATGVDTSGANGAGAIVQSAVGTGSGTSRLVTLASFADAVNNAAVGGFVDLAGGAVTAGTGFTQLMTYAEYGVRLFSEWRLGEDTSVDATAGNNAWSMVAVELKMAAAGGLSIPAIIAGRLPMFSPFGGGMVGTA